MSYPAQSHTTRRRGPARRGSFRGTARGQRCAGCSVYLFIRMIRATRPSVVDTEPHANTNPDRPHGFAVSRCPTSTTWEENQEGWALHYNGSSSGRKPRAIRSRTSPTLSPMMTAATRTTTANSKLRSVDGFSLRMMNIYSKPPMSSSRVED